MFARFFAFFALFAGVSAFITPSSSIRSTSVITNAKSKSVPFLEAPAALDGSMVGDVGFDPLGLSEINFDFSYLVVPTQWEEGRTGLSTIKWMREAEIKHGRVAMLATLGYVAVDLGLRFPSPKYLGLSSLTAHDAMVKTGDMAVGLLFIGLLELFSGVAIFEMSKGSDRQPGDFVFDPLGLAKDTTRLQRYQLNELKNGRLAMLAFSGIVTQAALTERGFPYMFEQ
jgi:light-harvesting complex I chlorophyll a/b binding protein 1